MQNQAVLKNELPKPHILALLFSKNESRYQQHINEAGRYIGFAQLAQTSERRKEWLDCARENLQTAITIKPSRAWQLQPVLLELAQKLDSN